MLQNTLNGVDMKQIDLKKLRFEQNLTQEELGNILGFTKQHIGRIEKGITRLSDDKANILIEKFNLKLQNNIDVPDDVIKIPYWMNLPEELKHKEYTCVLAQQQLQEADFRIIGKVIKNVSFRL